MTPIAAFDIWPDGTARRADDTAPRAADGAAYRWIHCDLDDPGLRDWAHTALPAQAAGALVQGETRPRCDTLGTGLILNLRGVNLNPGADTEDMVSLRLWADTGLIVSVRKRRIFAVDAVRQALDAGRGPASTAAWIETVAEGLTHRIEAAIADMEDTSDTLEEALLDGEPCADQLGPLRRKLIKLHRFLAPQREALRRLASADVVVPAQRSGLRESANRAERALETLTMLTDRAKAMQDQIHIENAERMSRNGMLLSIVASVFLPLGFITGLFGVNLGGMPGASSALGFLVLSVSCAIIALLLLWLFRKLGWF
ncbi:zinc transporter ZntB [Aliiroseovarius sp. PTFE2010]|uniref:zinc transporter ZntB n=1 Tax=Aliiroseovarius sp. PTFE2010 TaxID=3417190 RepID=UPI003CED114F